VEGQLPFITQPASRKPTKNEGTSFVSNSAVNSAMATFGLGRQSMMLVEIYGAASASDTRYSPADCIATVVQDVIGKPDPKHISTSYVKRQ
jgi:hypothetical protein